MSNRISSRDVAMGAICAKPVAAGVFVAPGLRVNTLTLAELRRRAAGSGRAIDRGEAESLGFDAGEIAEVFGPAEGRADSVEDLVMRP